MVFQGLSHTVNIVGNSAPIPVTSVFVGAPPVTGMWAVWYDIITSVPAASGTVAVALTWFNGVTNATLISSPIGLTVQGEQAGLLGNFYASNLEPISYNTTVNGITGNPVYTIRLVFQFICGENTI